MKQKYVQEIRAFNRFYTVIIGLLDKYILESHFTLPEARVLFELYNDKNMTASDIISSLHIDKAYLSRILKSFENKGLILRTNSNTDRRNAHIKLTSLGKKEFEILNQASSEQIVEILSHLSNEECSQLIVNMRTIKKLLKNVET